MATAKGKAAAACGSKEYPTEWSIYPNDYPDQRADQPEGNRAFEVRKPVGRESQAAAQGQIAVALG